MSAWDTIPSGTTVTGDIVDTGHGMPGPYGTFVSFVTYPAPLSVAPTKLASGPDGKEATQGEDAACMGTTTRPTAPAGQVCVYYGLASGMNAVQIQTIHNRQKHGFFVYGDTVPDAGWGLVASWAYTAP